MRILVETPLRVRYPDQRQQLHARARVAAAESTRVWARMASVIWVPIRMVGFSERVGSWNTIAMVAPRCLRISSSGMPTSSTPSIRADPVTVAVAEAGPSMPGS